MKKRVKIPNQLSVIYDANDHEHRQKDMPKYEGVYMCPSNPKKNSLLDPPENMERFKYSLTYKKSPEPTGTRLLNSGFTVEYIKGQELEYYETVKLYLHHPELGKLKNGDYCMIEITKNNYIELLAKAQEVSEGMIKDPVCIGFEKGSGYSKVFLESDPDIRGKIEETEKWLTGKYTTAWEAGHKYTMKSGLEYLYFGQAYSGCYAKESGHLLGWNAYSKATPASPIHLMLRLDGEETEKRFMEDGICLPDKNLPIRDVLMSYYTSTYGWRYGDIEARPKCRVATDLGEYLGAHESWNNTRDDIVRGMIKTIKDSIPADEDSRVISWPLGYRNKSILEFISGLACTTQNEDGSLDLPGDIKKDLRNLIFTEPLSFTQRLIDSKKGGRVTRSYCGFIPCTGVMEFLELECDFGDVKDKLNKFYTDNGL